MVNLWIVEVRNKLSFFFFYFLLLIDYFPVKMYFFCNRKNFKHSFHPKILSVAQTFHSLSHFQDFIHDFLLPKTLFLLIALPAYSSCKF